MISKSILFVDDEPVVLKGMERMLHGEDPSWLILSATSVREALEKVSAQHVDLVVCDVMLPRENGFSLLRRLSLAGRRSVPVIMVTGRQEHSLKEKALALGAMDLLTKPVSRPELVARLRSTLRLKEYQDELHCRQMALEHRVRERTAQLEKSRLDVILRLGKAAEYRDDETGQHVLRVGRYCMLMAERLGADASFCQQISYASMLHDLGKIGIPDAILLKPGPLERREWNLMRRHCEIGANILCPDDPYPGDAQHEQVNNLLEMARDVAMYHHEKWDGSGYPNRLTGEEIPISARLVAVADVYDALRSDRPYKRAMEHSAAVGCMRQQTGTHFDPTCLGVFLQMHREFAAVYEELKEQHTREVVSNGPDDKNHNC